MAIQKSSQEFELYADAASVSTGMDLYSRDGQKLGFVREVWAELPRHGYVAKSRFCLADYGPVRGTAHLLEGADGFVQVQRRRGIRAENERDLFFPLAAIQDSVRGEALIVGYNADDCYRHCADRPDCLAA